MADAEMLTKWRGYNLNLLTPKNPCVKGRRRQMIHWTHEDQAIFRAFLAQHSHSPMSLGVADSGSCRGCTDEALRGIAQAIGLDTNRIGAGHWAGVKQRMLSHFAYQMSGWVDKEEIREICDETGNIVYEWDESTRQKFIRAGKAYTPEPERVDDPLPSPPPDRGQDERPRGQEEDEPARTRDSASLDEPRTPPATPARRNDDIREGVWAHGQEHGDCLATITALHHQLVDAAVEARQLRFRAAIGRISAQETRGLADVDEQRGDLMGHLRSLVRGGGRVAQSIKSCGGGLFERLVSRQNWIMLHRGRGTEAEREHA